MNDTLAVQPEAFRDRVLTIVGAGSLGARCFMTGFVCGVQRIVLWDHDLVEPQNRLNQGYRASEAEARVFKVDALVSRAREILPESETEVVLHRHAIDEGSELSGIVMMCVDSMQSRGIGLVRAQASPSVEFFVDGRTGPHGGKVYGFDPRNEHHVARYSSPPHWHEDPPMLLPGCKGETPMPFVADIVAGHMWARLSERLQLEQGAADPYLNFYGFQFKPQFAEALEYWDEEGMDR